MARNCTNPFVITKLKSGWLVIGDVQPLPGYCVFLADPVVASLNDLNQLDRTQYSLDVIACGDAILAVTHADRMNYETWGNSEPALHTHLMPRYDWEDQDKREKPACMGYSWQEAQKFERARDGNIVEGIRQYLDTCAR